MVLSAKQRYSKSKPATRNYKTRPKRSESSRDTRFFIGAVAIAPLELAIGQSGAHGAMLIGAELLIAVMLIAAAVFWGPLTKFAPGIGSFAKEIPISGTTWLILVIGVAAAGWIADFGSRVGFQPSVFGFNQTSSLGSSSLTLKSQPAELKLSFGLDGRSAVQTGSPLEIWSWTAVTNELGVVFGQNEVATKIWIITVIFNDPILIKRVSVKSVSGGSVAFQIQTNDPRYIVLSLPNFVGSQEIVIRTEPSLS